MHRDDVMHIANETQGQSWMNEEHIQRFAKRLLEIEREACAQIALQWDKEHPSTNFGGCIARSIRTRGQHD